MPHVFAPKKTVVFLGDNMVWPPHTGTKFSWYVFVEKDGFRKIALCFCRGVTPSPHADGHSLYLHFN